MTADSDTPLLRKLGIKPATGILLVNAPPSFLVTLGPLPAGVDLQSAGEPDVDELDLIIFFAQRLADLQTTFASLVERLAPTGGFWIAWPKKSSGMATDLSDDAVRNFGLNQGLVDNKICSIDPTWSAQRFVVRLKDRPKRSRGPRR
jgi:hypothetical protein